MAAFDEKNKTVVEQEEALHLYLESLLCDEPVQSDSANDARESNNYEPNNHETAQSALKPTIELAPISTETKASSESGEIPLKPIPEKLPREDVEANNTANKSASSKLETVETVDSGDVTTLDEAFAALSQPLDDSGEISQTQQHLSEWFKQQQQSQPAVSARLRDAAERGEKSPFEIKPRSQVLAENRRKLAQQQLTELGSLDESPIHPPAEQITNSASLNKSFNKSFSKPLSKTQPSSVSHYAETPQPTSEQPSVGQQYSAEDPLTKLQTQLDEVSFIAPTLRLEPEVKAPVTTPAKAPDAEVARPEVSEPSLLQQPDSEAAPSKPVLPDWAAPDFQCLLFNVSGLTLAIPLHELNAILEWEPDAVTKMPGNPSWYLGVMQHREGNARIIDTMQQVMPEKKRQRLLQEPRNLHRVIMIDEGRWGLVCDEILEVITLTPEQVKWRSERTKRKWLQGTVIEHMCALIDPQAFATMLETGEDSLFEDNPSSRQQKPL